MYNLDEMRGRGMAVAAGRKRRPNPALAQPGLLGSMTPQAPNPLTTRVSDYMKARGAAEAPQQPIATPTLQPALLRQRLPSFKKGGVVEKTGIAKVHKGEVVVSKDNVEKAAKSEQAIGMQGMAMAHGSKSPKRAKKLRCVRIEKADNGGFTVFREYEGGDKEPMYMRPESATYSKGDGTAVLADVGKALGIAGEEAGEYEE